MSENFPQKNVFFWVAKDNSSKKSKIITCLSVPQRSFMVTEASEGPRISLLVKTFPKVAQTTEQWKYFLYKEKSPNMFTVFFIF